MLSGKSKVTAAFFIVGSVVTRQGTPIVTLVNNTRKNTMPDIKGLTPDNSSNDNCEQRKTYIAISARGAVVTFRALNEDEAKDTIINNLDTGTTWHFSSAGFAFKQIGDKEDKYHE